MSICATSTSNVVPSYAILLFSSSPNLKLPLFLINTGQLASLVGLPDSLYPKKVDVNTNPVVPDNTPLPRLLPIISFAVNPADVSPTFALVEPVREPDAISITSEWDALAPSELDWNAPWDNKDADASAPCAIEFTNEELWALEADNVACNPEIDSFIPPPPVILIVPSTVKTPVEASNLIKLDDSPPTLKSPPPSIKIPSPLEKFDANPNKILLALPLPSPWIVSPWPVDRFNFFNFASNEPVSNDMCSLTPPTKNELVKNTLLVTKPNPLTSAPRTNWLDNPDKSPNLALISTSYIAEPVLSTMSMNGVDKSFGFALILIKPLPVVFCPVPPSNLPVETTTCPSSYCWAVKNAGSPSDELNPVPVSSIPPP